MKFDELGIHAPILKALTEAGYVILEDNIHK